MKFNSFKQIFEFLTNNPDYHLNGSDKYLTASEAIKLFVKSLLVINQQDIALKKHFDYL